ncbi:hypothetical protein TOTORO_01740 [Serratia phage vB_SmaS-Totoro]|nr:hypothetical protein TOTORO_01740 [Serratia phage vB_SmaS-Totoro]
MNSLTLNKVEDGLMSVAYGERLVLVMDDKEEGPLENWLFVYRPSVPANAKDTYAAAVALKDNTALEIGGDFTALPVQITWASEEIIQAMLIAKDGTISMPLMFERSPNQVIPVKGTH